MIFYLIGVNLGLCFFFDTLKCGKRANILLDGNALDYVSNFKYLGHIIDNKLNDELDMKSRERMLYGRSNMC